MADDPNKPDGEPEVEGLEGSDEERAGGKPAILRDLASERQKRHNAETALTAANEKLAAIQNDATYQAAETLFLAGVPEDKVLALANEYLSGTTAEKKEIASDQTPEVARVLKEYEARVAEAERVAKLASQSVRERDLREDAIRFCNDYGVEPNGDEGKAIAAMARKVSATSGRDINYAMLSDLAEFRGIKKNEPQGRSGDRPRGGGGYDGPPPLERGGSAPVGPEPDAPIKIDPRRDVVGQLHEAAFKRYAEKHGGGR